MQIKLPCDGNNCYAVTLIEVEDIDSSVENNIERSINKKWGEHEGYYYCGKCWPVVQEEQNIPEE